MDVARDFPHCQAVAVDLVPMQSMQVTSISLFQWMLLTTCLLVKCLQTAGNVFLPSHPRSIRIFSIVGARWTISILACNISMAISTLCMLVSSHLAYVPPLVPVRRGNSHTNLL